MSFPRRLIRRGAPVVLLIVLMACARAPRPAVRPAPPSMQSMRALVPLPLTVQPAAGDPFVVAQGVTIVTPAESEDVQLVAEVLQDLLAFPGEPQPRIAAAAGPIPDGAIHLALADPDTPRAPESYDLTIAASGVTLTAPDAAGLFYGVQTLRQLLPPGIEHEAVRPFELTLPPGRIADAPRFAWRGAMLDVARHFFSVDDVKRYIDLIAMLKLNRLHLHLSDDQGWRIEITKWPNLTAHGGRTEVGGGPGGFYTQQQYADIVAYAQARHVTVVPEIDMPGHTNAALSSYPELNCDGIAPAPYTGIEVGFSSLCVDKAITYRFIEDVVTEIAALTPGPYFHIGGDEVKTLPDEQYRAFIDRVQRIVARAGKEAIGWDEIAPAPLLPGTIVQHWRPKSPLTEAVEKGARLIFSPADRVYVDMKYDAGTPIGLDWAAYIEVRDAYDWDPARLADDVPERLILGVEAPLWSETIATIRDIEYLAFPRMAAVAELAWSPADRRDWDDFRERLGAQARRWAALGINFYRSPQIEWQEHRREGGQES